jgi:hypothetical protein
VNVVAHPPFRHNPVSRFAAKIYEYPEIPHISRIDWRVGWLGFIDRCVPASLLFSLDSEFNRSAAGLRSKKRTLALPPVRLGPPWA